MGSALLYFLSGTPTPTPALKKEWHSFSTPFKRVCAPFSTPITKFLESKLPKLKKIVVRLNQSFSTSKVIRVFGENYFQIVYCIKLLLTTYLQINQSNFFQKILAIFFDKSMSGTLPNKSAKY